MVIYPVTSYELFSPHTGRPASVCDDPHAGEYYITYTEDGVRKNWSGNYPNAWTTYYNSNGVLFGPVKGCGANFLGSTASFGPTVQSDHLMFTVKPPFLVQFKGGNGRRLPEVGHYRIIINNGEFMAPISPFNCGAPKLWVPVLREQEVVGLIS